VSRLIVCTIAPSSHASLMHVPTHPGNAQSTGHYISHNIAVADPSRHPSPTQISQKSYQGAEKFPKLRANPCVHPCDGALRRSIIDTISGSRARFHRALRPPLSEDHSLAAPSLRVCCAHAPTASGP
jgi:hypothetical protein